MRFACRCDNHTLRHLLGLGLVGLAKPKAISDHSEESDDGRLSAPPANSVTRAPLVNRAGCSATRRAAGSPRGVLGERVKERVMFPVLLLGAVQPAGQTLVSPAPGLRARFSRITASGSLDARLISTAQQRMGKMKRKTVSGKTTHHQAEIECCSHLYGYTRNSLGSAT
jgi:hypothetical protein